MLQNYYFINSSSNLIQNAFLTSSNKKLLPFLLITYMHES